MEVNATSALMAAGLAEDALRNKAHEGLLQVTSTIKYGNGNMNLVRFLNYFY